MARSYHLNILGECRSDWQSDLLLPLLFEKIRAFVIGVKSGYAKDWLETGRPAGIRLVVWNGEPPKQESVSLLNLPEPSLSTTPGQDLHAANLNPRYTFESFVVGPGNRLAQAASMAVVEFPRPHHPPL